MMAPRSDLALSLWALSLCAGLTAAALPASAQDAPATTLQLLHASDLEGNADAVENAPNFAAIVAALRPEEATTLVISAGDNFIPSPFSNAAGTTDETVRATLSAALDSAMDAVGIDAGPLETGTGRFDIAIMNVIGFDASALGNHEFDFGPEMLAEIVGPGEGWTGALFPYLSANLEIGADSPLAPLHHVAGLTLDESGNGKISPYTIVEAGGERFGIIGGTTPLLSAISSPGKAVTTTPTSNDMQALAAVIQPIVDTLTAEGINKIILTTHLQQIQLEIELSTLLDGVDIYIAGGSDTRLANANLPLREGDEAHGPYPLVGQDAGGNDVAIVSTDGEYSYVGRLIVGFDADGRLLTKTIDPTVSGAYATDEAGLIAVTGAADRAAALAASPEGEAVAVLVDALSDAVLKLAAANTFADLSVDLNGNRQPGVRTKETNLGNLTADANLAAANALSDDKVLVSLKNGGGIRASIPAADGVISQLSIEKVLAFNNGLSLITLTPDQLVAVLEHGVSASTYDADGTPTNAEGRFPQVGGLSFTFDPTKPAGERVTGLTLLGAGADGADVTIRESGEPTAEADAFADGIRVVTLDFLLGGGDGYPYPAFVEHDADFADVVVLTDADAAEGGAATFAAVGTEQDAMAEYLAALKGAYDTPDVPAADASRIRNALFAN